MIKKSNKGFTLIELLVVIAIIGILSAVVLASLNTARNKGKAASAVGSMTSMRAQAEISNSNGSYPSTLCGTELLSLKTAVETQTGKTLNCAIKSDYSAWAASIDMTGVGGTGSTTAFCVDSSGFAGYRSSNTIVSSSTCPTS